MKSVRHLRIALITIMSIAIGLSMAACRSINTISIPGKDLTPTATSTVSHPGGPTITVRIVNITMFSATTGWGNVQVNSGSDNRQIAYTVDSGRTWHDVTPAGYTPDKYGPLSLYAMSRTEAWSWAMSSALAQAPSFNGPTTLWHTTDAGAHWTTSTVAVSPVKQLDFINSTTGWLAATASGAAGQIPLDIWHTTDSGKTWTHVTGFPGVLGHAIGIGFVNATTGFATGFDEAGAGLLITVTYDAGSVWNNVSLPLPSDLWSGGCCAAVEPPVFTSATNGVLEVVYPTNTETKLAIYRTTDAGATWTLGPGLTIPTTPVEGSNTPISVTASGEVFVAITATDGGVTLYDLPAGAASWKQIKTSGGLLAGLTKLDFFDSTHGWAVTHAGLIGTTDGGKTWVVLRAAPSGPFQVASVSMTVDPTSIAGMQCGTFASITYTATFHLAPNGAGGTVQFWYTLNNGRGQTAASIQVAAGQIVATYQFWSNGNLPADHTSPAPSGVMVYSPNSIQSPMVWPTGQCS
jgi:photosystem II stability/assembly factor-like uncharacterized protein